MTPLSPQESKLDLLLNPGAWLLTVGGALGIFGYFQPWWIYSSSNYHDEYRLLDFAWQRVLQGQNGAAGFNVGIFILLLPVLFVAILACADGLLTFCGKQFPSLSRTVWISAVIVIVLALIADGFSYFDVLSPPFIIPTPGQGQGFYIFGVLCAILGSLIELSSWNAEHGH